MPISMQDRSLRGHETAATEGRPTLWIHPSPDVGSVSVPTSIRAPNGLTNMNLPHSQNAGLYIHIPFCVKKCHYCDFYSVTDLSLKPRFLKALQREMELVSDEGLCFDTLYIGGGTPSVYGYDDIELITTKAFQSFNILPDSEITIEVNPGTVKFEQLGGYRKAGINRLNMGVQSFQAKNLEFLGRIHTENEAHRAIEDARRAGFENTGFDLIYGLPDQSVPDWLRDLRQAIEYQPEHISCYTLTYEKGTSLYRDLKEDRIQPLDDETVRVLFETTIDYLFANGYEQYEISNFARSGHDVGESNFSRHNLKYWSMAPYIGLGPSAHSFIEPERHWNYSNVAEYISEIETGRLPIAEKEVLTIEQQIIEAIYLGLRMTRGIDLAMFKKKFGIDFVDAFKEIISDLNPKNYMEVSQNYCALTQNGRAFLDSITARFINQDVPTKKVKN